MYSRILLPSLLLLAGQVSAQTSYPMITHASPVTVQRGKTAEATVSGQMNLGGVYKALFDGEGLSAEGLPPPAPAPRGWCTGKLSGSKTKRL